MNMRFGRYSLLPAALALANAAYAASPSSAPSAPGELPGQSSPADESRVPLHTGAEGLWLEVTLNGQGPFRFGFDTRISDSLWLDRDLAVRLKLPMIQAGGAGASDGSDQDSQPMDIMRVATLQIGQVVFRDVQAFVPPLFNLDTQPDAEHVYGTLGFGLFQQHLLTLDWSHRELRIATGQLPPPDGHTVLAYDSDDHTAAIRIQVGSRTVRATLDFGGAGGMWFPPAFLKKLPLAGEPSEVAKVQTVSGKFTVHEAQLNGQVRIGPLLLTDPKLRFAEWLSDVHIGREVLHRLAVTFDQKNRRVRLVLASQPAQGNQP